MLPKLAVDVVEARIRFGCCNGIDMVALLGDTPSFSYSADVSLRAFGSRTGTAVTCSVHPPNDDDDDNNELKDDRHDEISKRQTAATKLNHHGWRKRLLRCWRFGRLGIMTSLLLCSSDILA